MQFVRIGGSNAAALCRETASEWAASVLEQMPDSDDLQRGQMNTLEVAPFGALVRKHYFRGGLVANWNRDHYWFLGESSCRSFHEFRVLNEVLERGLPAPQVVAAFYWRRGLRYQAELYTSLIPQALSLQQLISMQTAELEHFKAAGRCIRQFHNAGLWHADLNAMNLVFDAEDQCYLLDFDQARWRKPKAKWKHENLSRLLRSIDKICQRDGVEFPKYFWQELNLAWQRS